MTCGIHFSIVYNKYITKGEQFMSKEMLFLCDVYDKYLEENDLPHRSADDILYGENAMALTSNQKYWLESFIATWEIIAEHC